MLNIKYEKHKKEKNLRLYFTRAQNKRHWDNESTIPHKIAAMLQPEVQNVFPLDFSPS